MEHQVYSLFSEIQSTHWWFVARRMILADILRTCLAPPVRLADIGCGTGAMLPTLAEFGEAWGIDSSLAAVALCAQKKLPRVYLSSDPAWQQVQFDALTFLDVIEHVEDDTAFVQEYLHHLKPGGLVLITVPAFEFLWSEHDVLNHHFRRYHAAQLRGVLARAGLEVERLSYFNTWLFPAVALARAITRMKLAFSKTISANGRAAMRTDFERGISLLNRPLQALFASERIFLRHFSFPFGVSLFAIARKALVATQSSPVRSAEMQV